MELIREACVETKEQLDNALEKHAEQIELCSRLDLGGLTPNHDLIEYALNKSNNILIMIRNNDNFSTSFFDLWKLKKLVTKYAKTNVRGFVFGFLTPKNLIDEKAVRAIIKCAKNKETVFHMAFDMLDDPISGIDTLWSLGVTRILTKGGKSSAMNNLKQIKRLQEHANDKIQLIIGGDVNDDNYQDIHHQTGATRFHGRKLAYKYN